MAAATGRIAGISRLAARVGGGAARMLHSAPRRQAEGRPLPVPAACWERAGGRGVPWAPRMHPGAARGEAPGGAAVRSPGSRPAWASPRPPAHGARRLSGGAAVPQEGRSIFDDDDDGDGATPRRGARRARRARRAAVRDRTRTCAPDSPRSPFPPAPPVLALSAVRPGEFEQAVQQLMQGDAPSQVAGAKRLSALLKPQTLVEDVPVEIARPDAAEEERLAQLRQAWSTAVHDPESADHEHARAEGLTQEEEDDGMLLSTLGFGDLSFDMVAEALAAVDALGLLPRRGGEVSGGTMVDFTARGGQFALAAALLHPFDYVLGVEGGEDKCAEARGRLDSLQSLLSHVVGDDDRLTHEVSFEHSADSTNKEVEENGLLAADFVAINCAGLNEFQINDLGEALLGLRRNAVIICFGRRAPCPGALILDTRTLSSCQWDDFPCYIMQRIGDGQNEHLPPVELPECRNFPASRSRALLSLSCKMGSLLPC